jgi:hypothetical protein
MAGAPSGCVDAVSRGDSPGGPALSPASWPAPAPSHRWPTALSARRQQARLLASLVVVLLVSPLIIPPTDSRCSSASCRAPKHPSSPDMRLPSHLPSPISHLQSTLPLPLRPDRKSDRLIYPPHPPTPAGLSCDSYIITDLLTSIPVYPSRRSRPAAHII